MGLEQLEELKRKPIELNLLAARKRQSAQTGFVHFCHESPYGSQHDTIPILENFCFALALLRSRNVEQIAEAKMLLQKLLSFESNGNFPVYLHEYPMYRDRLASVHLLPVLYWILKDFKAILGSELKTELTDLNDRIIQHGLASKSSGQLSKQAEAKLLAALGDASFLSWLPQSAGDWGHYFQAWQMLESLPFPELAWNNHLHAFISTNKRPFQEKLQPALSLLDIYMGANRMSYSARALQDHPTHLLAALVQPFSSVRSGSSASYSLHIDPKAELPINLWWGCKDVLHSLVCSAKKAMIDHEDGNSITFTWNEPMSEDVHEQSEVVFFCNLHPDHRILVNGQQATAFRIHDHVEIHSKDLKIQLIFSAEEGNFFGHIARSNRPYQRCTIGENLHESYDHAIALRTVRRPSPCTVRVQVKIFTT